MASVRTLARLRIFLFHGECVKPWTCFYSSYKTNKKKHSYDLKDLIEWKKETNLAFGPSRKLTKTGKMRKSSKSKGQWQEHLESLSCMNQTFGSHESKKLDIPAVHSQEKLISLKESIIIGDESSSEKETELAYEEVSTRVLKMVPKSAEKHSAPYPIINLSKPFTNDCDSDPLDPYPQKRRNERKGLFKKSVLLTENDANETIESDVMEDFMDIPKIHPIPQSKSNSDAKASVDSIFANRLQKTSSNKENFKNMQKCLPVEPPKSFEIINNFPFCVDQENSDIERSWEGFQQDVDKMSLRLMPSVKTILSKTMPDLNRFFLQRWREGMIKELGEEGFKLHQEVTIKKGINLHANIMEFLSNKPISQIQIMPDNEGHWASLQTAFVHVKDVKALEASIIHPRLLYRGVFDCIAKYRDFVCVIDWKTSKKPRPLIKNTYDDPVQVAAYIGALNASQDYTNKFGQVNHGMIVVAYPDGSPAHIHVMDKSLCEQYWRDWTDRLHSYYQLIYTEKFGSKSKEKKC